MKDQEDDEEEADVEEEAPTKKSKTPKKDDTPSKKKKRRASEDGEAAQKRTKVEPSPSKKSASNESGMRRLGKTGIKIKDLKVGIGAPLQTGKKVFVEYEGRLANGKVFDKSKKPMKFTLGVGNVIKGWDLGLQGMRVGGQRFLEIPPKFAYGVEGVPGRIPSNSTLHFVVEAVKM